MIINSKPITLSVVTVKLDSKKLTNSLLDQIPRLDFCELLVDEDGCYDSSPEIVPICRFSLPLLLNSQVRIYKASGLDSRNTERLIRCYDDQDEAFLFTYHGQLYTASFSATTGTLEFGNQLRKLEEKIPRSNEKINSTKKILESDSKGLKPVDIVKKCSSHQISLPRGHRRSSRHVLLDNFTDDVVGFDESEDTRASVDLASIIKKYGSWEAYIDCLKQELILESKRKMNYERDVQSFHQHVSKVIREIEATPFTILGV